MSSNVFAKTTRLRLLKVHSGFHIDHKYGDLDSEEEMYYCYGVIAHASKMQLDRGFKFPSYELRYLCWDGYPLDFLPSNFDGGKLVELHLHCSNITRLWLGNKVLLSFNNDFFFFVLILKFMIVMSLLTLIFFLYRILKG